MVAGLKHVHLNAALSGLDGGGDARRARADDGDICCEFSHDPSLTLPRILPRCVRRCGRN